MFALFAAAQLFAAEILDTEMSAQDKKSTGLYKLTDREKAALQQWIDAHYQKTAEPAPAISPDASSAPTQGIHPTLSENLMGGRYLRLSDGTLWEVRTQDVPITQSWITPAEIMVSQSTHFFYTYRLTNKISGSSVLVRKADKLPQPNAPALAPESGGKTY